MQKYKKITGKRYEQPKVGGALSLSDLIDKTLKGKRVEPVQRMVGGKFGHAVHRYPIKGGISLADVVVQNLYDHNALFRLFSSRGPK